MKLIRAYKYGTYYTHAGCLWEYNGMYYLIQHKAYSCTIYLKIGTRVIDMYGFDPWMSWPEEIFRKSISGSRADYYRIIQNPEAAFAEHIL